MSEKQQLKHSIEVIAAINFDLVEFNEEQLTKDYVQSVLDKTMKRQGIDVQVIDLHTNEHIFR